MELNVQKQPFKQILRQYLGEVVYGGNDGIITTFAVVSGVMGAQLSVEIIFIICLVNLFADGFSMAASNFLSIRSQSEAKGEDHDHATAIRHAFATFIAFVFFGGIPVLGILVSPIFNLDFFICSAVVTALTLFSLGALRAQVSHRHWLMTGSENLLIGVIAAIVAYVCGFLVAPLVG